MTEGKDLSHDVRVGVPKDLILEAVKWLLIGWPIALALVWAIVQPVRDWLSADSHLVRGAVVALVMLLISAATVIAGLVVTRRRGLPAAGPQPAPPAAVAADFNPTGVRSEERRVGKECRYRRARV